MTTASEIMTVTFSGANDDLIHCSGDSVPRRDPTGKDLDENSFYKYGSWLVTPAGDDERPFRVLAIYDGCWSFAISLLDEGDQRSVWATGKTVQTHHYALGLEVQLPANSTIALDTYRVCES